MSGNACLRQLPVTQFVAVFKFNSSDGAKLLWGGAGANRAGSLEQLRKRLAGGQFSDTDNY
jgi:hypothetical protein